MVPPGCGGALGVTNPGPSLPVPGDATTGPPSAPTTAGEDWVALADPDEEDGAVGAGEVPAVDDEHAAVDTRTVASTATAGSRRETRGCTGTPLRRWDWAPMFLPDALRRSKAADGGRAAFALRSPLVHSWSTASACHAKDPRAARAPCGRPVRPPPACASRRTRLHVRRVRRRDRALGGARPGRARARVRPAALLGGRHPGRRRSREGGPAGLGHGRLRRDGDGGERPRRL